MAKGTTFSGDLLGLILNAAGIANLAENASSSPLTSLYLALHNASPVGGTAATNEISLAGYSRASFARNGTVWSVSTNVATSLSNIAFGTVTSGTDTATFISITTNGTVGNASKLLWYGALSPTISLSAGITAILQSGSTVTES